MPQRIDIGGGDPQDEIDQALRQLTQRGQSSERETSELDRAVQEVAAQQKATRVDRRRRTTTGPWPARLAWGGIAAVVIALIVVAVMLTRPEPLPPPAITADAAVRGFWTQIIEGHYESATAYYPGLETQYGSRKQAAVRLREQFRDNPPMTLGSVDPPEQLSNNTKQYRVAYEFYKRSGLPVNGEFIVLDTGNPASGFIIINGAV